MNKIFGKIITTILLCVFTILILIDVIMGRTDLSDGWRFGLSFFYGIICGYFVLILWKPRLNYFPSWVNWITAVFSIFSLIVSIVPDLFYSSVSDAIDNLHDRSNNIDFTKEFYDSLDNEHLTIFALDRTKYTSTDYSALKCTTVPVQSAPLQTG